MKKTGTFLAAVLCATFAFGQIQSNEINSTGKVGVGTTTPTCALDVDGQVIIDGETTMKQDVEIEKTLTIKENLEVLGISTFGAEVITEDQVTFKQFEDITLTEDRFVVVDKNGILKSTKTEDILFPIGDCHVSGKFGPELIVPNWAYGPGKIVTGIECPSSVGIRVENPTAVLDVDGNTRLRGGVGIGVSPSTTNLLTIANPGTGLAIEAQGDVEFQGNMDVDGSVGIGVDNSTGVKLHVISDMQTGLCVESNATTDYSYGLKVIADRDLTKAFSVIDETTGTDIFMVWGNGVVNTKKMYSEEIEVRADAIGIPWPDYVFSKDYDLKDLSEVEAYYTEHNHLEGIPSAADVAKDGINVAEMDAALLKKIEELTIYIIQLEERVKSLEIETID
ncbi:MAG: hypothetical protein ACI9J3_002886 [Parvicellaceae bacterium]|jgi:hypothetical protein